MNEEDEKAQTHVQDDEAQHVDEDDIEEEYGFEHDDGVPEDEMSMEGDDDDDDEDFEMERSVQEEEDTQMDEEPITDTSIGRLDHHQEAVFCVATHPINPLICASGGADDLGHIWNLSSNQHIFLLDGHRDSISTIEFSPDGLFLATGALDASIKIWKTLDLNSFTRWEFLLDLETSEEVTWLTWHPTLPVLLAGFSDGLIYMWQIPTGSMRVFSGHDSMTTCGTFTPDGQKIISGTESGMLFIWDPKTAKAINKVNLNEGKYAFKRHEEEAPGVNSVAINQASTICIVGGISNGGVRVVNLRIGSVIAALDQHESNATVEVAFYEPEGLLGLPLLVSSGTDGLACIHDASSFKLRNSVHHKDAISSFTIHKQTGLLTTGSLDKTLSTWDLKTAQQLKVHTGHRDIVHMVKLTCDHQKLISCSDDGFVLVFDT